MRVAHRTNPSRATIAAAPPMSSSERGLSGGGCRGKHRAGRAKRMRRNMKTSKNSSPAARPGAARADVVDVEALHRRFVAREATIGVIGLGYVGLPLVGAVACSGFAVLGFDIDGEKGAQLNAGRSYIRHIPDATIGGCLGGGRVQAVADCPRVD